MDIHNSRYRLDCDIENLKSCKEISEANKRTILGYVDDCFIRRLSVPRVEKLIRYVSWYGKQLDKPFKKATKEDIKKMIKATGDFQQ